MRSDPRRARFVASLVAVVIGGWFLALFVADEALFERFGSNMHAITFLCLFAEVAALVAVAVLSRWARVRRDLLEGRDVVGHWTIDRATFAAAMPDVVDADRRDKRQVLLVIWGFLAVIFGAFALYDPSVAVPMLATAVGVAALTGLAYLTSLRRAATRAEFHDGRVILGRRGLLVDGELHVWSVPPVGWLETAVLREGRGLLDVVYGWVSRYGWQSVTVSVPVPAAAMEEARHAVAELGGRIARPRRRKPRAPRGPAGGTA